MAIESSANYISQLNPVWPRSEDFIAEGDDHIRLIKDTLKKTFPNFSGPITASQETLNKLNPVLVDKLKDIQAIENGVQGVRLRVKALEDQLGRVGSVEGDILSAVDRVQSNEEEIRAIKNSLQSLEESKENLKQKVQEILENIASISASEKLHWSNTNKPTLDALGFTTGLTEPSEATEGFVYLKHK